MAYLTPVTTFDIPASPKTEGYNVQRLVVERHQFAAPKTSQQKWCFLWSHSNGFHKESLHPLMRRFRDYLRSQPIYDYIDFDFVAWDARNHGDSARLNEGTYLETYTWFDNAMDTKQVVDELELRAYDVLIGVGHSFGATSMLLAEHLYPKTFDGLCVIEPVVTKEVHDTQLREMYPVLASRKRRDTWASREECFNWLAKRPFWRDLHPEVLENYVNYGLYETAEGPVKLKCPREQEYHVFKVGYFGSTTAFASLRALSIPVHFVSAKESTFVLPEDAELIKAQSPFVSIEFIDGSHMVPTEKPDDIIPQLKLLLERMGSNPARLRGESKL
ncbi:hypothetical protein DFQ28_001927 [Apophysomyces sp. BC1034]|nr:hypothetical protein DFQ30_004338 [Apophysomyces sp. BC1015]KAG0179859.1 hypothetical protein DFQ29_001550 [Apophysomyces sp. BC1021]KAG0190531.1 hypothetical protein DFQ28_001927 [Apophysomyces sp. BC1034]